MDNNVRANPFWNYVGDADIERGGVFYEVTDDVEAMALAITPMGAHIAPGSWIIVHDGVIMLDGDDEDLDEALATCEYERVNASEFSVRTPTGEIHTGDDALKLKIEAFHAARDISDGYATTVDRADLPPGGLAEYVAREWPHLARIEGVPHALARFTKQDTIEPEI